MRQGNACALLSEAESGPVLSASDRCAGGLDPVEPLLGTFLDVCSGKHKGRRGFIPALIIVLQMWKQLQDKILNR